MKFLYILLILLLLTSCDEETECLFETVTNPCYEEVEVEVEVEVDDGIGNYVVGVYRCEGNVITLNQSKMPLVNAGIDVVSSHCADLKTPITEGAETCKDGEFTQMDVHIIPHVSLTDAIAVEDYRYIQISPLDYRTRECT